MAYRLLSPVLIPALLFPCVQGARPDVVTWSAAGAVGQSGAEVPLAAQPFGPRSPAEPAPAWQDPDQPLDARVEDLLKRLTVDEKVDQLHARQEPSGAVERLGIAAFGSWTECLHGVVDYGNEPRGITIFPAPIGMAASFDGDLLERMSTAVSDELRAKSNLYWGSAKEHRMLNCFGPNINIVRDPRWGRGAETYGEDPHLTASLVRSFVRGLQGNHSHYIKVGATCKHFAAYSLEAAEGYVRRNFDARVNERDMLLTYTPAFEACTKEAGAASVMCAYSSLNGVPACASDDLLGRLLRDKWGWHGFVVSDCGAVEGVTWPHMYTKNFDEGAAATLKAGTDMNCPDYGQLRGSLKAGLVGESDLDAAVRRVLAAKFRVGAFDPRERVPWTSLSPDVIASPEHLALAREAARKSVVLLKNDKLPSGRPTLPLPKDAKKVVVLGPHADRWEPLLSNYYGKAAGGVQTLLDAMKAALGGDRVQFSQGSYNSMYGGDGNIEGAIGACADADACVFFLGLSMLAPKYADGPDGAYAMWAPRNEEEGYDRTDLRLPGQQELVVEAVARATSTPIVVVLIHGGALDVSRLAANPRVGALATAWYPGQGAAGVADVLVGNAAPSGRLPVSFYYNNYTEQISMAEMDMQKWPGRTYRYLQVPPLYPFGFGLSYTTFVYSQLDVAGGPAARDITFSVQVKVANTGAMAADEVVLLFVSCTQPDLEGASAQELPHRTLRGFKRISLAAGEAQSVRFQLGPRDFRQLLVPGEHSLQVAQGAWRISVGDQDHVVQLRLPSPPAAS